MRTGSDSVAPAWQWNNPQSSHIGKAEAVLPDFSSEGAVWGGLRVTLIRRNMTWGQSTHSVCLLSAADTEQSHWEPKSWNRKWEGSLQFTLALSLKPSVIKQYFSVLTNLIMAKRGSVLLFAIKKSEFISQNLKRQMHWHITSKKQTTPFSPAFLCRHYPITAVHLPTCWMQRHGLFW